MSLGVVVAWFLFYGTVIDRGLWRFLKQDLFGRR